MKLAIKLVLPLLLVLGGCATQQQPAKDHSAFNAAAPRSILIVPVINKSLDVDAPNYVLSTLTVPLAEKGFYVFPVHTTKFVLEQEGFYEGEQISKQSPQTLSKMFGADAVLYVTINRWDAQYVVLSTVVTVEFDYRMVDKNGQEIWATKEHMRYQPQNNNSSGNALADLIATAVMAAMERAKPNYMPLARQANQHAFVIGPDAPPNGPYWPATKQ